MHIISKTRLQEFGAKHADAQRPLLTWFKFVKKNVYSNHDELKKTFPTADKVGKYTVFDIGGNKYRLITTIHYNRKKVFIRNVLTHADYDQNAWNKK